MLLRCVVPLACAYCWLRDRWLWIRWFSLLVLLLGGMAPTSSAAAHEFWRVLISSQNGANNTVIMTSLVFYDSSGTILAGNGTGSGTASASSCFGGCPGSFDASKAFDGVTLNTNWNAAATPTVGSPQWIEYDFGSAQAVAYFSVDGHLSAQAPESFKLQSSDNNSTWADETAALNPVWGWSFTFPVSTPPTRSFTNFRVKTTTTTSGNSGLAEISLATVSGGSTVVTIAGWTWADSCFGGCGDFASPGTFAGLKAWDSNNATFWDATGVAHFTATPLNKAYCIVEIKLTAPPGGNNGDAPLTFTVDGSNDGASWTSIVAPTTGTWTSNQQKTFTASCPSGGYPIVVN